MYELIREVLDIPVPFNMVIVIVFLCTVSGVITGIAKEVRKFAVHRMELDMKREMVDRGMPPEDIERVIRAGEGSQQSRKC